MTSTTAEVEARRSNNGRTPTKTTPRFPSSSRRRTPSFSSTSSLSSSNSSSSFRSFCQEDSPTSTPSSTPFHPSTTTGEGIPFSWESIPGIPKKPILKKIDSSRKNPTTYLPLPPVLPTTTSSTKSYHHNKKHILSTPRRDPFFTALVECSKAAAAADNDDDEDDHNKAVFGSIRKGAKSARSRFGFVNTMSCKNSSAVTESLVFLPRAPPRIAYDMLKKRSG